MYIAIDTIIVLCIYVAVETYLYCLINFKSKMDVIISFTMY